MNTDIFTQSKQLQAAGNTVKAINLLKQNPDDVSAQILLREYYLGEQCVSEAMEIINQFPDSDDTENLVNQSILAFYKNEFGRAVDLAEQALMLDTNSFTALNHLGRALQNLGLSGKAIKAFKSAVKINPEYAEAWHNFGHTRRAQGLIAEAKSYYQKAIALHKGYQSAWFNLALSESVLEEFSSAVSGFQSLLKINPQHVLGWINLGLTHHVLGQIEKAIACYDEAMEIDPNCALAYSYKGIIFNELQDTEAALECLQHAIELDPNEIDAWCELTNVYEKNNDLTQAKESNKAAKAIDAAHPTVLIDGARLLFREKKFDAALSNLHAVNPNGLPIRKQIDYWFETAHVLEKLEKYKDSFHAFEKGNKLATTNPKYLAIDATAYWQRLSDLSKNFRNKPTFGWLKSLFQKQPVPDRLLGHELYFLMGFPRSGTTLLDTILNSHKALTTIEEKPTFESVIEKINEDANQYDTEAMRESQLNTWRNLYWQTVSEYVSDDTTQKIIDKLPLRFIRAQLISTLFPQSKSIFMLRHPCDVILSNFMQNYMPNQAFVHFNGLAESVEMYTKTMSLWLKLKPLMSSNLIEIKYENLVLSPEQEMLKICQFIGVEFQPEILETSHRLQAKNRISTNSYAQVASDIHDESIYRWKNYQEFFAPYLQQIEPFIQAFGYQK